LRLEHTVVVELYEAAVADFERLVLSLDFVFIVADVDHALDSH
jgi:hypothetical protein